MRVGDVGDVGDVGHRLAEIVGGGQRQEDLRDGLAVERRRPSTCGRRCRFRPTPMQKAPASVSADPSGFVTSSSTPSALWRAAGAFVPKRIVGERVALQALVQHVAETPLLALQPVGMLRLAREPRELERGDDAVACGRGTARSGRSAPARSCCRRRRSAPACRASADGTWRRAGRAAGRPPPRQRHRHACVDQQAGGHEADGAGSDDQDSVVHRGLRRGFLDRPRRPVIMELSGQP